ARRRLELDEAVIHATRRAPDAGAGIALRIAGREVAVRPATRGERRVDEAPGPLVEAPADPRGRADVAPRLDQSCHLHALALASRGGASGDALGGTIGGARRQRSVGGGGEVRRENVHWAERMIEPRAEHVAKVAVERDDLEVEHRDAGEEH